MKLDFCRRTPRAFGPLPTHLHGNSLEQIPALWEEFVTDKARQRPVMRQRIKVGPPSLAYGEDEAHIERLPYGLLMVFAVCVATWATVIWLLLQ